MRHDVQNFDQGDTSAREWAAPRVMSIRSSSRECRAASTRPWRWRLPLVRVQQGFQRGELALQARLLACEHTGKPRRSRVVEQTRWVHAGLLELVQRQSKAAGGDLRAEVSQRFDACDAIAEPASEIEFRGGDRTGPARCRSRQ